MWPPIICYMCGLAALAFAILTLKQDQYPLRTGCGEDYDIIATARNTEPVEIRFARTDDRGVCYKIAVKVEGKPVEGYVPASALNGLEEFERERRSAREMNAPMPKAPQPVLAGGNPDHPGVKAAQMLQQNQPSQALVVLEAALERNRRDAGLLALAGVAAYRSDQVQRALGYWKESLEIAPNPEIERLSKKAERESKADKSGEKLFGMRFLLRYEDTVVSPETARAMVAALEEEYSRISFQLGCGFEERIVAIVQSRQAYLKTTDAAEWSGGQYDGRIRVALLENQGPGPQTRRAFAHELVHACLASIGTFPAWLHEGLAQKLSGDSLPPGARERLKALAHTGKVPRLDRMSQTWSRLSAEHAAHAYQFALAAIELFFENYSELGIRNLLRNPQMLAQVTEELDRRLR